MNFKGPCHEIFNLFFFIKHSPHFLHSKASSKILWHCPLKVKTRKRPGFTSVTEPELYHFDGDGVRPLTVRSGFSSGGSGSELDVQQREIIKNVINRTCFLLFPITLTTISVSVVLPHQFYAASAATLLPILWLWTTNNYSLWHFEKSAHVAHQVRSRSRRSRSLSAL
jgi:hypothetical protein